MVSGNAVGAGRGIAERHALRLVSGAKRREIHALAEKEAARTLDGSNLCDSHGGRQIGENRPGEAGWEGPTAAVIWCDTRPAGRLARTAFEAARRAMRHHPAMDRSRTLALLGEHKPVLAERFGVTRLALFGSVARGTAQPGSDLDVLVDFDGVPTARRYFGVQFYLEDLFGLDVDLVTADALRPRLRPYVERDAVDV